MYAMLAEELNSEEQKELMLCTAVSWARCSPSNGFSLQTQLHGKSSCQMLTLKHCLLTLQVQAQ